MIHSGMLFLQTPRLFGIFSLVWKWGEALRIVRKEITKHYSCNGSWEVCVHEMGGGGE